MGTMNLGWMAALALLILLEKDAPHGERIVTAAALVLFTLGALLVLHQSTLPTLT
jgi:predicted metal-binding membrane protein